MSAKLMKPTVNVKAKNPTFAVYGHVIALIAGVISVVFGLLGLFSGEFLRGVVSLILALIVIIVELDTVKIEQLKDALVRGILWIVFAVIGAGTGELTTLLIAISGILYLVYHFK